MKIVVAMDSFKGSLSAPAACRAVRDGLLAANGDFYIEELPVADGGEGTAQAMLADREGEWIPAEVMGPLPDMTVAAGYAWFPADRTALVEMATASGLTLVPPGRENPLETTTFGTGELMAAAAAKGARRILLAVGGSATVDGGTGAAQALGWRFLDGQGNEIGLGGGYLSALERIERPAALELPPVEVLCDVRNTLTGPEGAARVYGPQKGAAPAMAVRLEAGLVNLAVRVREQLGTEIENVAGAGAAGGLSAGAIAFIGAKLVSGIDTVLETSGLQDHLKDADWVVTGEGRFDSQSLYGKVVAGVAAAGRRARTRIAVLAGRVAVAESQFRELGIEYALPMCSADENLRQSMAHPREHLQRAATQLGRILTRN